MSSNPQRPKGKPPAVDDLRGTVADLELTLVEVGRLRNTVYTSLPGLMAAGDAEALTDARTEVAKCDRHLREKSEELQIAREALKLAQQADRALADAASFRRVSDSIGKACKAIDTLEAWVKASGALRDALIALDEADAEMGRCGVPTDPYSGRAVLEGTMMLALHLASGGRLGKPHPMLSDHELRQSDLCSIRSVATKYRSLALRRARSRLNIEDPTPPRAA